MRYGDLVTVQQGGVYVEPKELEPIGIFPDADCWGVLLPDWDRADADSRLPNLLVSPFMPASWPILIQIVLRLNRGDGALHKAASVLVTKGLNILSYDCTPSGYHHLTWTLVGEHAALRQETTGILAEGRNLQPGERALNSPKLLAYAQNVLAIEMLRYGKSVASALIEANRDEGFLHKAFTSPDQAFGGRLYRAQALPDDVREDGIQQEIRTVRWRWLQDLAFFWLYGGAEDSPLLMRYHRESNSLRLHDDRDRRLYSIGVGAKAHPLSSLQPSRTLALFDTDEQYMRVLLDSRPKVHIKATYGVDLKSAGTQTTCGLLRDVMEHLDRHGVNVLHVANSIRRRSEIAEDNSIEFIGERLTGDNSMTQFGTTLNVPVGKSPWLPRITMEPSHVAPHRLFISTRIDWNRWRQQTDGGDVRRMVVELARIYGFEPVIIDEEEPSYRPRWIRSPVQPYLLRQARIAIQRSSAFLQIIPQLKDDRELTRADRLKWMNLELGVAIGCGRPHVICLDTALGASIVDFSDRLVTDGYHLGIFESTGTLEQIARTLRKAVEELSQELTNYVSDQRRP